jgi:uncharacterized protein YqeY
MMSEDFAKSVPFGSAEAEVATKAVGPMTKQLKADLVAAMKAKDEDAKGTLRMALAALQNAQVAEDATKALTEDQELKILTKEVHTREEAAATYAQAGRPELAAKETTEAEFLKKYLPAPLTDAEVTAIVDEQVAKTTADLGAAPTMKQMGAIVKAVNAVVKGRAEGAKVAALVKARLA